jgi:hypothetical protein
MYVGYVIGFGRQWKGACSMADKKQGRPYDYNRRVVVLQVTVCWGVLFCFPPNYMPDKDRMNCAISGSLIMNVKRVRQTHYDDAHRVTWCCIHKL